MGEPATTVGNESVDELVNRVGRRLRRAGIIANGVGAIDTFIAAGFVLATVVGESESNRLGLINGPIVLATVLLGMFVWPRLERPLIDDARRWLAAGGPPGGGELAATLAIPRRCAIHSALRWGVSALLFTILNL